MWMLYVMSQVDATCCAGLEHSLSVAGRCNLLHVPAYNLTAPITLQIAFEHPRHVCSVLHAHVHTCFR